MLAPGDRLLAAVSGGLDSMCLLDLLAGLRDNLEFELVAASFDHGLRGEQGKAEMTLVEGTCANLGIGFFGGGAKGLSELTGQGANLQEEARRQRYSFLWQAAGELNCNRLATGHHRDDQAETVLLRLTQGSGFIGLAGIRPVSREGRLIRPLLCVTRSELEEYARERAVRWLEDPTNAKDGCRRNRLRHHRIPRIEREGDPEFSANLAALAEEAAGLSSLLDEIVEPHFAAGMVEISGETVVADCTGLAKLPSTLRRHLLRRAVERITAGRVLLSGRPLAALEKLAVNGLSGQRLDFAGGVCARREFERLLIGTGQPSGTTDGAVCLELSQGINRFCLGGVCWELDLRFRKIGGSGIAEYLPHKGADGAISLSQAFDADCVELPLTVSRWRPGDRIGRFGAEGSKKLKKLFTERRIPRSERDSVPVVSDRNGTILWVCGVSRAGIAALTAETANVMLAQASRTVVEACAGQAVVDT